jgi:hypothetical protein
MSTIPPEYLDDSFDFGFTAVDEEFITSPVLTETYTTVEAEYKAKLKAVEQLIIPLLVNLMKNPEKDYIKWPNRTAQIQKQIDKILAITRN